MSAPNLMTLTKRTSLNVYGADIFTYSRHGAPAGPLRAAGGTRCLRGAPQLAPDLLREVITCKSF